VRLPNRATRRLSVTHKDGLYHKTRSRLLIEHDELDRQFSSSRDVPKGLLRINATFVYAWCLGYMACAVLCNETLNKWPRVIL